MNAPLLDIRDATKVYGEGLLGGARKVTALRGCNLSVQRQPATVTAIAGESGSGKSTLAGAVLGFVRLTRGQVLYKGQEVSAMSRGQRLEYRREVQAIFQDPYAAFNPFYRTEHLFNLVMKRFRIAPNGREARDRVEDALAKVGLRGDEVLDKHPHQLSGGQRQRIMVARACLMAPRLIVADEPVSMVDASLRSMILDIMLRLRDENGISFLYITHDLSTAHQISDDIHIFYRGVLVENGPVTDVLHSPQHPYTQMLIESIPLPDPAQRWGQDLQSAKEDGEPLSEAGCCFCARCPRRMDRCRVEAPVLRPLPEGNHQVACHLYDA